MQLLYMTRATPLSKPERSTTCRTVSCWVMGGWGRGLLGRVTDEHKDSNLLCCSRTVPLTQKFFEDHGLSWAPVVRAA
jgi:hypothetical protein